MGQVFGGRFLAAAGAVLVGLLAGYWHFAEMLERPATRTTAEAPAASSADPTAAPASSSSAAPAPDVTTSPPAEERQPAAETQLAARPDDVMAAPETQIIARSEAPAVEAAPAEPPSFDLLRVEPDGAAVIAGRAPAGSEIVLMNGTERLASDTVSAAGEFALALAVPLPVGDHELRLEAVTDDGSVGSRQTALISIPRRGREEELMVLVEEPDQPTRLVETPTVAPSEAVAAAPEPPAEEPDSIEAIQPQPQPQRQPQVAEIEEAPVAIDPPAPAEQVAPVADMLSAEAAPEPPTADPVVASLPTPPAAAEPLDFDPQITASAEPRSLAIGAVEIENDRMYVAGTAEPEARVRLYLDDGFLAEAIGGGKNEFLASAKADVAVGPHVVRADQIGRNDDVVARVEVPFDRPEGTSMSAVAALPPVAMELDPAAEVASPTVAADVDAPAVEAGAIMAETPVAPAASPEPADPIIAQAPSPAAPPGEDDAIQLAEASPVEPAAPALIPPTPSLSTPPVATIPPEKIVVAAAPAPSPPEAPAPIVSPAPAAPPASAAPSAARVDTRPVVEEKTVAAAPIVAPPAARPAAEIVAAAPAARTTLVQPALQSVNGRVIIRRGDTLWRISKNAYGLGSRYTVIYLANGGQIRDPDLIYPGQIFSMPGGRAAEGRTVQR